MYIVRNIPYEVIELLYKSIKNILECAVQHVKISYDKIIYTIFDMLTLLEMFFQNFHQFIGNVAKIEIVEIFSFFIL